MLNCCDPANLNSSWDFDVQDFAGRVCPFVFVVVVWDCGQAGGGDSDYCDFGPGAVDRWELDEVYVAVGGYFCFVVVAAEDHEYVAAFEGVDEFVAVGHCVEA